MTDWHDYFMGMAQYVATASKDPSTKCGAVIVRLDRTVVSTGYNGFPRKCSDNPELYLDRTKKYSRIVHAEMNAILTAQEPLHGYTLYCTLSPCDRCAACIIQAGIKRVIIPEPTPELIERWGDSFKSANEMFTEAFVHVWHV